MKTPIIKPDPPKVFLRFFRWFCHPKLRNHIEGDLFELYLEQVREKGKRKADLKFIADVLLLFRPGIIRPAEGNRNVNQYAMYKSYFKIGWRNLAKNKGYSFINIGGLALGMAVAMVIGLWVFDELSFNHYHTNYQHIAQVMKGASFQGKEYAGQKSLPYPLLHELTETYSSNFKHVVPTRGGAGDEGLLATAEKKLPESGMFIGEGGPEMFSWKMVYGTHAGLKDLQAIMISESTAKALYGDIDPVGQGVKLNAFLDLTVTGVYEDFPKNTMFYGVDFFRPWKAFENDGWITKQSWENHFFQIYVEIQPQMTFAQVGQNIKNAEMDAIKNLDYMKGELQYNIKVLLLPMDDLHLHAEFKEGVLQTGPVQLVWFIGIIGAFVLLLACINFMNLSTARSEKRGKEVGIRKAIGSIRGQLIGQFFSESFLVVLLAFSSAVVLVSLSLPWFNELSGKEMHMPWELGTFWLICAGFLFITAILAGSYPALYLSSFKPVAILKGTFRAGRFALLPRKILVVIQFTVSVVLIACTGVIYHQLMFVKDRPVGYDREGLLMVGKKSSEFDSKGDVLRAALKSTGAVTEVSESGGEITNTWSGNGGFNWAGKTEAQDESFGTLNIDPEFGKTVGWKFVDGRDFARDMASDSSAFVLNEAAVKYMGLKNPVGEKVRWTNGPWHVDRDFHIIGVIQDMLLDSPFEPVEPTIYFTMGYKGVMLLRINPDMPVAEALPKIEAVFSKVIPDIPFSYKFTDEEFARKFSTEDRIGKLAAVFTTLAIVISCLGLFGLASFVAEQRTKEIGIRKILGASVMALWRMLSREFVMLVVLSCMIAVPLSYYILYNGLKGYEYRTEIGWKIFAGAAFGALSITLLTVSFQAIKAALANPVNSLRSE